MVASAFKEKVMVVYDSVTDVTFAKVPDVTSLLTTQRAAKANKVTKNQVTKAGPPAKALCHSSHPFLIGISAQGRAAVMDGYSSVAGVVDASIPNKLFFKVNPLDAIPKDLRIWCKLLSDEDLNA
ncbi:unnamed protein product [Symbiodinium microadriaticum]|nr:unnamed protein product [Symbiodinium microadriaticum]